VPGEVVYQNTLEVVVGRVAVSGAMSA